jgi:hypothetical protein
LAAFPILSAKLGKGFTQASRFLMSLAVFLPLLLSLAICAIPVWLLRQRDAGSLQNYFVAPGYTAPQVIRNSSTAHVLRLAAFGPLFVFGARGDFWPVIIVAVCFGLGVYLVYLLRDPILEFLAEALASDRSITIHSFIARQHGGDPRIRQFAAAITLFTLVVFVTAEAFALAGFVKLIVGNDTVARVVTLAALLLAALYAFPAGNPGTMQATQLQLGMIHFSLFGMAALLLYLHLSALTPLPPHSTFAILFVAVCCIAMLIYRRSRYVDAGPIDSTRSAKILSKFGKIFNPIISVLAVTVIVFALMEFSALGFPAVGIASVEALQAGTDIPAVGLIALALLPLFYPIADIVHWQRLASAEKNKATYQGDELRWLTALSAILKTYARESGLLWFFIAAMGAIAVAALALPGSGDVMQDFVQALMSGDNEIITAIFSLLLLAIAALALSAMSSALSAGYCAIRYDMLSATAGKRTRSIAGRAFFLAIVLALILAEETLPMTFTSSSFLALLFALVSPALAFAPLIIGPAFGRRISPDSALIVLGSGVACTAGGLIAFVITGNDTWLWAVAPASLACGFLLLGLSFRAIDQ